MAFMVNRAFTGAQRAIQAGRIRATSADILVIVGKSQQRPAVALVGAEIHRWPVSAAGY
ncbi:MAG: hypothetical protein HYX37_17885 [Rhizobiales bacterium]|nr:hypothetical protein [Hyphomicrobiales bacterium]